jgi:ABC-2 type transport system permease protein
MSTYVRDTMTVWNRELIRLYRSKSRLLTSLMQPILWLVLFGTVFNQMFSPSSAGLPPGTPPMSPFGAVDAKSFLVPGIVAMTVLFGSIFSGIGVIFDREFGFLKEMLVAPVSRTSIVAGKALGGSTSAIIGGVIILGLSTLIGAKFTPSLPAAVAVLLAFVTVLLLSFGFVMLGIAAASKITSMEGFQMVMNFLVMPMFFVSSAFYPLKLMPDWLQSLTYINPMFYGVDALRGCINGASAASLPLWQDLSVLLGFTLVMTALAVYLFRQSE